MAVRMMASGWSFVFDLMYTSSFFSFFSNFVGVMESVPSSSSRKIMELPRFRAFLVAQLFGSEIMYVAPPVIWIFLCSSFSFSLAAVVVVFVFVFFVTFFCFLFSLFVCLYYISCIYICYIFYVGLLYNIIVRFK